MTEQSTPPEGTDVALTEPAGEPAGKSEGEAGIDAMTRAILATANAYSEAIKDMERGIAQAPNAIERAHSAESALITITTWLAEAEDQEQHFATAMAAQRQEIKARIAAAQAAGNVPKAKAAIRPYRRMVDAIDKVLRVSSKPSRQLREARERIRGIHA